MRSVVTVLLVVVILGAHEADAQLGRRRAVRKAPSLPAVPQMSIFTPEKDNTLYESTDGSISNGAGIHVFAGATGSGAKRRAVMVFDLASRIPPGSRITAVTLTMRVSQTLAGPVPVRLHRLLGDWGEGTSDAGASRDGVGTSSTVGDATWIHAFFADRRWQTAGGDFVAAPDATASVGGDIATWSSSPELVARIQEWVDQPAGNFGWIVIGDESARGTAKRFDSREIAQEERRPTLVVEWMARIP